MASRSLFSRAAAVRHGLSVAGVLVAAYWFVVAVPLQRQLGYDAYAYWVADLDTLYDSAIGNIQAVGAFRYSPAMAQLLQPVRLLEWPVFLWFWLSLLVGTLIWLAGKWTLATLAFLPVVIDMYTGNIQLLLAAAIVLGFRYPAAWSLVLLTKVTPGVGLLWFAVRREWRSLGIAIGTTAVIGAVSFLAAPHLWSEWVTSLRVTNDLQSVTFFGVPVLLRMPLAAGIVAWGALTDRRWTVPIGATLALPVIWWPQLSLLVGVIPLLREELRDHATDRPRTRWSLRRWAQRAGLASGTVQAGSSSSGD